MGGDGARRSARERLDDARATTRERMETARESTRERMETARESTRERVQRARMTTRRLLGLDRSGPPPPETLADQPWRPWTLPNLVGFVRLALIPVFVALVVFDDDGVWWLPAVVFWVATASDYLDGMLARITGQYSRLGALLDPLVDRLVVIAGVGACWYQDLLPRWLLALAAVREVYVLVLSRIVLRAGGEVQVNWWGRLAVWPTMGALFLALLGVREVATVLLWLGVAMGLVAAGLYTAGARRVTRQRRHGGHAGPST